MKEQIKILDNSLLNKFTYVARITRDKKSLAARVKDIAFPKRALLAKEHLPIGKSLGHYGVKVNIENSQEEKAKFWKHALYFPKKGYAFSPRNNLRFISPTPKGEESNLKLNKETGEITVSGWVRKDDKLTLGF